MTTNPDDPRDNGEAPVANAAITSDDDETAWWMPREMDLTGADADASMQPALTPSPLVSRGRTPTSERAGATGRAQIHVPKTTGAHRPLGRDALSTIIVATVKRSLRDDCSGLAVQAAYHILFAIFPLAIFAAALSALVNSLFGLDLFDAIMASLTSILPGEARVTIVAPIAAVVNHPNGRLLLVGIVTALWSGATAVGTFITALNRAYDVRETRPYWRRKGLEILLTLGMGAVVVVAFVVIVFGGRLGAAIAGQIGLGRTFRDLWQIGRWPLIAVIIMAALTVFYRVGANIAQRSRWLSPGAILGTLVWIATIGGFGAYVRRFGRYDKTYGTLGGVIILLLAFYLTSLIVIVGGELNAEIARRYHAAVTPPFSSPASQARHRRSKADRLLRQE